MTGVVAPPRARVAWTQVGASVLALMVVLVLLMPQYGYHRDELYFRMLPPAWVTSTSRR